MKVLTKLFVLCVGLASLWCGTGPAKADWSASVTPVSGHPIRNANGGSGNAQTVPVIQPPNPFTVSTESDENGSSSTPYVTVNPDYEMQSKVVYTWNGTAPPSLLTLTFSVQATADSSTSFSAMASSKASASTDAVTLNVGAVASASSGSSDSDHGPVQSQTVTFPSASSITFHLNASASSYGYVYGGSGGGFTNSSSASATYGE